MGNSSLKLRRLWLPSLSILAVMLTLVILLSSMIFPDTIQGNSPAPLQSSTATVTPTPTTFLKVSTATLVPTKSSTLLPEAAISTANCTYTTFFWNSFPERWVIENIIIGDTSFTQDEAVAILATEALDERTFLLQQFIAGLLNTLKGADAGAAEAALITAGDWLNAHPEGVEIPASDRREALEFATLLARYNNGDIGPGPCPDQPLPPTPTPTSSPTLTHTPSATPLRTLRTPTDVPRPTKDSSDDQPTPTQAGQTEEPTQEPTEAQPTNTPQPQPTDPPRATPTPAPTQPPPTEPPPAPTDEPTPLPTQ